MCDEFWLRISYYSPNDFSSEFRMCVFSSVNCSNDRSYHFYVI